MLPDHFGHLLPGCTIDLLSPIRTGLLLDADIVRRSRQYLSALARSMFRRWSLHRCGWERVWVRFTRPSCPVKWSHSSVLNYPLTRKARWILRGRDWYCARMVFIFYYYKFDGRFVLMVRCFPFCYFLRLCQGLFCFSFYEDISNLCDFQTHLPSQPWIILVITLNCDRLWRNWGHWMYIKIVDLIKYA